MSKWKERIPGMVISVLLVAVFAVFMVILLQSKMVPTKLLILGGIALVLLVASAVLLVRSIRNKGQFICGASLSLVLALVLGLASNYISVATGTLTEIGTVRTEYTPVAVYVRTDDPASAAGALRLFRFALYRRFHVQHFKLANFAFHIGVFIELRHNVEVCSI